MRPGLVIRVIVVLAVAWLGWITPEIGRAAPTQPATTNATRTPLPGEHIAFSLGVAQERIRAAGSGRDWRTADPELFRLGGINKVVGLVIDRQRPDIILVGHHDPDRPPLTLDDFAVALRARFVHGAWPLVSIDPTEETKRTGLQRVRMEGGIEDTAFGADLLDADYRLKRIGMGLLPAGVPNFETYWELGAKRTGASKIEARFWFYPIISNVAVREDVVAAKGLKVGVFTEVLGAEIDGKPVADVTSFRDPSGDAFAEAVSARFEELGRAHPSFARTQGLNELLAVAKGLEDIEDRPDLTFWLDSYRAARVETPRTLQVLKRREPPRWMEGGVQLQAIALRLRSGDPTALKDAVLVARPSASPIAWTFVVGEWVIPMQQESLSGKDMLLLLQQALFLALQKRHREVIALYSRIIELEPSWDWPYHNRGIGYFKIGELDHAVADFSQAISLNPRNANAYSGRCLSYQNKGEMDRAVADCMQSININPNLTEAYNNRGVVYAEKGELDLAIADFNRAISRQPYNVLAYNNRGTAFIRKGNAYRAVADFNHALTFEAHRARTYCNRAAAYAALGELQRAIADYNYAIALDPRDATAYFGRGNAYAQNDELDHAIADYGQVLSLGSMHAAEAYNNRGITYIQKSELKKGCIDLQQACIMRTCRGYELMRSRGYCH